MRVKYEKCESKLICQQPKCSVWTVRRVFLAPGKVALLPSSSLLFLQALSGAVLLLSEEGRILFVSEEISQHIGYTQVFIQAL
jgi:hypothetical protein